MKTAEAGKTVALSRVQIDGESYFKISNSDAMRPFFMSIISHSDHWMFISSNGGLSAGRRNAENALFPYYTDDKITESADITGSKTLLWVSRGGRDFLWEPFSERQQGRYQITRDLFKAVYGNKILFEETNQDLGLSFRYRWCAGDACGFIRQSTLVNHTDEAVSVSILDGIQNILPWGVPSELQMRSSNLVDAYKRSELDTASGLGIYALSAIIVDKAEPSEALKANVAWSLGLKDPQHLLSSLQLDRFRSGLPLEQETDVKGEKGAYFLRADIQLGAGAEKQWMIMADVNKDHSAVAALAARIRQGNAQEDFVARDISAGTQHLIALSAAADALQLTADRRRDARHFSNVLFNIMRGGVFDDNYRIDKADLTDYLAKANKRSFAAAQALLAELPDSFSLPHLKDIAAGSTDPAFARLCLEYLPLKFSRRHGDPSRPWNKFSINLSSDVDGSKILDYEGNWRDIFQNWEALARAYPGFTESMVYKFLNATTFDGYNPYRVTKSGFDWETIEADDPWSYIGYWGDHQIIYLLKLLEFLEDYAPGRLAAYFHQEIFVYANVPYRIKSFAGILKNPKDTIEFDRDADHAIRSKMAVAGADGALLCDQSGVIYQVNFVEKILATLLAKLANFIPEGGIWMNTQRPEWNDANNALVGNGVSVVTMCYLRRFLQFFKRQFVAFAQREVAISDELAESFGQMMATLKKYEHLLSENISDRHRALILTGLGQAGSDYRSRIYQRAFSGKKSLLPFEALIDFVELSLRYLDHAIAANRRPDALYHAYNLMTVKDDGGIALSRLSEMLEGQVAVLSSGYLSAPEALQLLDALRASRLFRTDQNSYLLYPEKDLPGFMEKNKAPEEAVATSVLLQQLLSDGNLEIIQRDVAGVYHFNGRFKNAADLGSALDSLSRTGYALLVAEERQKVLEIFEQVFDHKSFTGRSGSFFGYEGLGSIYWHMVSKLQLAVQECCLEAIARGEPAETAGRLLAHYYEIGEGIGVHKSPLLYGAFPTDPYSHTPAGKGVQQPGMTGQVKEDILSRFGELGVFVRDGRLCFDPCLLTKEAFLEQDELFEYIDLSAEKHSIPLGKGSLGFTFCQTPVICKLADQDSLEVMHRHEGLIRSGSLELDAALSREVFARTGQIARITVHINAWRLAQVTA